MHNASNESGHVISLITLDHAWPKQDRLLFMIGCSIFGCLMNGFFVASFFVEDYLNRIGLVFQASVGLSDMIVSMIVIPVSPIILLSGEGDTDTVCYALQFLTEASTYTYSIFFAMMSAETYYRLCKCTEDYAVLISKRIEFIVIFVLSATFLTAAVGVYLGLDYDCCCRLHYGNFTFRMATNIIFHVMPCFITIYCSVSAFLGMKYRADTHAHYRKSQQFRNDRHAHFMNILAFILYVGAWLPCLILINGYPATKNSLFYPSVWLGVGRSVVTSFFYGIMDSHFRRAFTLLFSYCFCKNAIANRIVRRNKRAYEYHVAADVVRLRLMQQAAGASSPLRSELCPRDRQ